MPDDAPEIEDEDPLVVMQGAQVPEHSDHDEDDGGKATSIGDLDRDHILHCFL